jgi:type VI secretion system protein ImpE
MEAKKQTDMKEAKVKLDGGYLDEAIEIALNSVKSSPTNIPARTFLFELSCFSGNWDRADKQLDVIGQQDVNAMVGAQIYKQNLQAERDRLRHSEEGLMPECLLPPPKYVEKLLIANNHLREGRPAEARQILDETENERPAFTGKINGEEFKDFRDYNDLTSCVFETIIKGSYSWIPFEQVQKIEFSDSKSLRDRFWIQAEVEMINGTKGEMFFPALYANSWKSDNDQIRLGKATDWHDAGEDIFVGEGLRVFQYDGGYKLISDLKTIEFDHQSADEVAAEDTTSEEEE